jgi:hypothetical protein
MSFSPPDSQVGLASLVQRISRELVAARDHLHHVELALDHVSRSATFPTAAAPDDAAARPLSHIARLQSLDLVMQLLAELAGCLDRLSHDPALIGAGSVDGREILRGLRLADLQRRLGNLACTTSSDAPVELF